MPLRRRDYVKINALSKGIYPFEDAAEFLGLGKRHFTEMLNAGKAPSKYASKLQRLGEMLVALPIDPPPPSEVIGLPAYRAINALRRDEAQIAEAIASKAMRTDEFDWQTGQSQSFNDLQKFFNRLAHGMAWSQSPKALITDMGLPRLYWLHHEVTRHLATHEQQIDIEQKAAWDYLHSLTLGCSLAFFTGKLGLGWYASDAQRAHYADKEYRKRLARKLLEKLEFVQAIADQDVSPYQHRRVTIRVAWNAAQLATVAESPGTFIWAMEAIFDSYPDVFEAAIAALNRDADTKVMMADSRVSKFVTNCLATLKEARPDQQALPSSLSTNH